MENNQSEIRDIFELALTYYKRVNLKGVFPTRALRDMQSETSFEEFLRASIPICKKIGLPITNNLSYESSF